MHEKLLSFSDKTLSISIQSNDKVILVVLRTCDAHKLLYIPFNTSNNLSKIKLFTVHLYHLTVLLSSYYWWKKWYNYLSPTLIIINWWIIYTYMYTYTTQDNIYLYMYLYIYRICRIYFLQTDLLIINLCGNIKYWVDGG